MRTKNGEWEAGATVLDHLAAYLLQMNAQVHFTRAETTQQREAVFRLRCKMVLEQGWGSPEEFPDGLEHDPYDDDALLLTVWDQNILAATMRVVFPSSKRPLPTEEAFGMMLKPRGKVVDFGRTAVHPAYRRSRYGPQLLLGLMAACWLEIRERGYSHVCGIVTQGIRDLYQERGVEFMTLAPAQMHWGEERFPLLFDVAKSARAMSVLYALPI